MTHSRLKIPCFLGLACLAASCSLEPWSGREGTFAEDIRIDTLRFLPYGSRYVLRDSATPIRFIDISTGYALGPGCASILAMGVDSIPRGTPPAYAADSRVRLPGNPENCAVDSGGRDTTFSHVFTDGSIVRLSNSALKITDSATLVAGTMRRDSIKGIPGDALTFQVGPLTFRDSSSLAPRFLFSDTVHPCKRMNHADFWKGDSTGKGDTITVHYSWVILDPVETDCGGAAQRDSVPVFRRRR